MVTTKLIAWYAILVPFAGLDWRMLLESTDTFATRRGRPPGLHKLYVIAYFVNIPVLISTGVPVEMKQQLIAMMNRCDIHLLGYMEKSRKPKRWSQMSLEKGDEEPQGRKDQTHHKTFGGHSMGMHESMVFRHLMPLVINWALGSGAHRDKNTSK